MNVELGAWSAEPAEKRMSRESPAASDQGCPCGSAPRHPAAFTLLELLAVVAIIAIMSSLLAPAVQGLMGMTGRIGGLNTVTAALDQARLAAIENGVNTHVGFPINAANKTNGFSHIIIFRDAKPQDSGTNPVALTRWQRLPNGVFFQPGPGFNAALTDLSVPARTFPRLGGTEDLRRVSALTFNRFGQLRGVSSEVSLELGEKIEPTGNEWRGGGSNYYQLRIQPLTGRVIVDDAALPNQ